MHLSLPKDYNSKIMKAITEFNLIDDGDKIMIGLSGGKDSLFLLYALRVLQEHTGVNFALSALTINYGFMKSSDLSSLKNFCRELGIEYHIIKTNILEKLVDNNANNPCAKCSYLRKALMADFTRKKGYNKLALGHHYDDAVTTFLISIIYSGQLKTLLPKRYLSKKDIYIIRPLIYLREKKININQPEGKIKPINNLCPFAKDTKRNIIKDKLKFIYQNKQLFYNLVSAMRDNNNIELWPEKISEEVISKRALKLWKN